MNKLSKKECIQQYKTRQMIGGVYVIRCQGNGRTWLKSTSDLQGEQNRFQFALSNNSCLNPAMLREWNQYGSQSFSLQILEELKKKETQSDQEFADDVRALLELWKEREQEKSQ